MEYAVEMLNINKKFGSILANDDVTIRIEAGEIHALLGENGAGKSTIMSILFGLYNKDSGVIKINGVETEIRNPNDAVANKIGMVHQHFKLIPIFSVLENIILGREDVKHKLLDYQTSRKKIEEITLKYGFNINLDDKVENLSVGAQQKVEIIKMLYQNADILIFDEPTAVLTPQEIDGLFEILRNFKREGKTIIIITHKLAEIKLIADRCSILRKGKFINCVDVKSTTTQELAKMMVGRDVIFEVEKKEILRGNVILSVNNLNYHKNNNSKALKLLDNINFECYANEILGIAGIESNGQQEIVNIILGLLTTRTKGAQIILNGKDITSASINQRIKNGISYIPEDRQNEGLIMKFSLEHNEILNRLDEDLFNKYGFLRNKNISDNAKDLITKFDVRHSSGTKGSAKELSGGNQQKLIISRELTKKHNLLIAFQPTRGLDVGAIEYVHKFLVEERNNGNSVLLISLEIDEIMSLSDRIIVLHKGKIVADKKANALTVEELGEYMLGIR